jgi:hypothetical protein
MGAAFAADGGRTDATSTFMIYDTATGEAEGFEVSYRMVVVPRGCR